jgi:hypothetical protein
MKERLTRCLQLLKLNHDDKITKIAFDLIEKSGTYGLKSRNGNWIIPLNAIAGSCLLNQRVISQSEVYDFLTVAVTTSLEKRTKAVDELIFRIYKDIMATYEGLDDKLKIAYPKIIIDVVSISNHQIQHAASSIRKVKLYIENVLDGKFVPRGSYGINHTKHNLEYGYLVVGLMERSRKSKERIPKKKET